MSLILNGSDTSAGDDAGLGYTSAEGVIITGQGSTSDVTIKNDADATVLSIPTGTTKVGIGTTAAAVNLHVASGADGVAARFSRTSGGGIVDVENYNGIGGIGTSDNIPFRFNTNNTERVRILNDGKVGIGTTAPDSLVEISSGAATTAKIATTVSNNYAELIFEDGNAGYGFQVRSDGAQSIATGSMVINDRDTGSFPVVINEGNATNTLFIGGSNVLIQSNAAYSDGSIGNACFQLDGRSGARTGMCVRAKTTDGSAFVTSSVSMIGFVNGNGLVGNISTDGSATSFNTSSDYRLKENVSYSFDATTRLKQLKPARFNFKTDADTTVDGFLAHEVSSIVPEAVTGAKDAVDGDGDPIHQSIDQSKLVPLLVKTIQEQQTVIEALEARISTLEGS